MHDLKIKTSLLFLGLTVLAYIVTDSGISAASVKLPVPQQNRADSSQIIGLMNEAAVYVKKGETKRAILSLERALNMANKQNAAETVSRIFSASGEIYFQSGNYNDALHNYLSALQNLSDYYGSEEKIKIYRRLGDIYFKLSLFNKALAFYKKAVETQPLIGNESEKIIDLANQAKAYFNLGEFSMALAFYNRALQFANITQNKQARIKCLGDIGNVYFRFGDYNGAFKNYKAALDSAKSLSDHQSSAENLLNIGLIYSTVRDSAKASQCFTRAYEIFRKMGYRYGQAKAYRFMGELLKNFGAYSKAIRFYEYSLPIMRQSENKQECGLALIGLGDSHFRSKNPVKASSYFKEALAIGDTAVNQNIRWKAHFGLGQIYEANKSYHDAFAEYTKAINAIEKDLSVIYIESQRAGFFENTVIVYETYINLLTHILEAGAIGTQLYAEEALHVVERSRARSFLESLVQSKVINKLINNIEGPFLESYRLNLDQKNRLEIKLRELSIDTNASNIHEIKRLEEELTQLEKKMDTLRNDIHAKNPGISQLEKIEPIDLESLQKVLSFENRFLLEYMLGPEKSYVWGIDKNHLYIAQLPPVSVIQEQVEIFSGGISSPDDRISPLITKPGRKLFNMLIGPMASKIEPGQKLLIIPDGILNCLPFEMLIPPTKSGSKSKIKYELSRMPEFLFEKNAISYAPSATIFTYLVENRYKQRHHVKGLLAIGDPEFDRDLNFEQLTESIGISIASSSDFGASMMPWKNAFPLPFSKEEVRRIGKLFSPGKAKVLVGYKATEDWLKYNKQLVDYRCIHFATHGIINESHPELSGLLLSRKRGSDEDGFLRIPEIFDLEIRADLVVLSACQTARGKLRRGNGLENMTRAFLYAGTPSVVVSLWNVDDQSTAEFMEHFYRFLIVERQSKDIALKNAKLEMIKSKQFAHPYYWAMFVLMGDSEGRYVGRK